MEAILFVIVVAAVSMAGVGLGLALAPRLARWDERRSRTEGDDHADGGGHEIE
jgi:hypothetical protein